MEVRGEGRGDGRQVVSDMAMASLCHDGQDGRERVALMPMGCRGCRGTVDDQR